MYRSTNNFKNLSKMRTGNGLHGSDSDGLSHLHPYYSRDYRSTSHIERVDSVALPWSSASLSLLSIRCMSSVASSLPSNSVARLKQLPWSSFSSSCTTRRELRSPRGCTSYSSSSLSERTRTAKRDFSWSRTHRSIAINAKDDARTQGAI